MTALPLIDNQATDAFRHLFGKVSRVGERTGIHTWVLDGVEVGWPDGGMAGWYVKAPGLHAKGEAPYILYEANQDGSAGGVRPDLQGVLDGTHSLGTRAGEARAALWQG